VPPGADQRARRRTTSTGCCPMKEATTPNSTSPRWLAFAQSLTWLCQRCPGAPDKWAYGKLQQALLEEICRLSEGVPIDKFRYPYGSGTADLVVLIRSNFLAYEDIRWQNVQCNLDWLERDLAWFKRDWPPPTLEAEAAPTPAVDAIAPTESPAVLSARSGEIEAPAQSPAVPTPEVGTGPEEAPVPAAEAALKPIEPAATESVLPNTLVVSKPAQSSLEVPASVSPPPQEPTPILKWDPQSEWSVERAMQELGIPESHRKQKAIAEAVSQLPQQKRYRAKSIPEILDTISAADLYRAIGLSSPDSCEQFVNTWKAWRARTSAS